MADRVWIEEQLALLGLAEGDPGYEQAVQAAERGWAAWRIARLLGMEGFPERGD